MVLKASTADMNFEFDPIKSVSNKAKHGLDFIEAQALWLDVDRVRFVTKSVNDEVRYVVLGAIENRVHTVIVTYRRANIRIIIARKSSLEEVQIYGQHKTKNL